MAALKASWQTEPVKPWPIVGSAAKQAILQVIPTEPKARTLHYHTRPVKHASEMKQKMLLGATQPETRKYRRYAGVYPFTFQNKERSPSNTHDR